MYCKRSTRCGSICVYDLNASLNKIRNRILEPRYLFIFESVTILFRGERDYDTFFIIRWEWHPTRTRPNRGVTLTLDERASSNLHDGRSLSQHASWTLPLDTTYCEYVYPTVMYTTYCVTISALWTVTIILNNIGHSKITLLSMRLSTIVQDGTTTKFLSGLCTRDPKSGRQ